MKIPTVLTGLGSHLRESIGIIKGNRLGELGGIILIIMLLIAIFGPAIAPYEPLKKHLNDDGTLQKFEEPSASHPLGTTGNGRDILSQLLAGARAAIFVGLVAATISISIGTAIGVLSGYFGGYTDDILMRITDVFYGIPILPFAIVALTILDRSIIWIVLVISLIYWRNSARVIRSQVLTLKEEEFIRRAKTTGAGDLRIIQKQILPNIFPVAFLYFAFATGFAIVMAASIAFLGFGDPNRISWGRMIFAAWNNNGISEQPLWVAAPAICIIATVFSVYFVGQTYEEVANPQLKTR